MRPEPCRIHGVELRRRRGRVGEAAVVEDPPDREDVARRRAGAAEEQHGRRLLTAGGAAGHGRSECHDQCQGDGAHRFACTVSIGLSFYEHERCGLPAHTGDRRHPGRARPVRLRALPPHRSAEGLRPAPGVSLRAARLRRGSEGPGHQELRRAVRHPGVLGWRDPRQRPVVRRAGAAAQRDVPVEGGTRSLLDEVDVISSVSGGSFTAAYYALEKERIFDPEARSQDGTSITRCSAISSRRLSTTRTTGRGSDRGPRSPTISTARRSSARRRSGTWSASSGPT